MLRMTGCRLDKLTSLSLGAVFDVTCADEKPDSASIIALNDPARTEEMFADRMPGVTHVNNCGRPMPVLRVLQTSHCDFNCKYCGFRRDIDRPRESLEPDELASTTVNMTRAGIIEGLFLSSGIGGNVRETMTKMIDTARMLREKHFYTGYLHLKILPGAPIDLIEYAGR
ncbi:MAG: hypothetical protein ABIC40_00570, partial [bacterium]